MKILHIADMTEFHIKIDSVIYRSVVEENKIDGVSSFLYSSSVTDNKNEFILGGDLNIKEFIKNEMPDLVIFHSLYKLNNLKIYPLLKSLNIKYAIRPHGSLSRAVFKKNLLKKTFFNLLFFNRFIKNASGIIFLSKGEMKQSFFRNGKNIFLPNMIDIKILESNMEKKTE
ncbi:hypothetical protein [Photobacterium leiognathi]|uniref:hypothetical protein n=1 Tax=Photobacterium leiognathi TaxID=553611 RepID=UPI0027326935|nr:hypothetical protein [Photobacterium leiognathi]